MHNFTITEFVHCTTFDYIVLIGGGSAEGGGSVVYKGTVIPVVSLPYVYLPLSLCVYTLRAVWASCFLYKSVANKPQYEKILTAASCLFHNQHNMF